MAQGQSSLQRICLAPILFYQRFISPLLGPRCRFHPSCSEYARQAILEHGSVYGIFLTCKRIVKCQPLCAGGFDPVPPKKLEVK